MSSNFLISTIPKLYKFQLSRKKWHASIIVIPNRPSCLLTVIRPNPKREPIVPYFLLWAHLISLNFSFLIDFAVTFQQMSFSIFSQESHLLWIFVQSLSQWDTQKRPDCGYESSVCGTRLDLATFLCTSGSLSLSSSSLSFLLSLLPHALVFSLLHMLVCVI